MKLGLGLYRHMLDDEHFAFAKQAGCTHIVAHLVDYFRGGSANPRDNQPTGSRDSSWGRAGDPAVLWTVKELVALQTKIEAAGLHLEAIENLDPAHWYDILLDGPRRSLHIENVKMIIRRLGEARIPILGYNFSIAGVCGRVTGPFARGGAVSVALEGPVDTPIPKGTVWNMVYDPDAPAGFLPPITQEQLWDRLQRFLEDIVPVAESAGVRLAAHPDDPPMPVMRQQPRLVYRTGLYQKLLDAYPSTSNQLEFCLGTLAEMTDDNLYEAIDSYSRQHKIAYVHFRNVRGKVPFYREAFVDDGDIDMTRVLSILSRNGFDGVLIPDHSPLMTSPAPWHSGMAFTLGYMSAAMQQCSSKGVLG
jgi:mannonate dehydratase